jgi:2-dehydro-3-deoxyphosphogalactonate aldolase
VTLDQALAACPIVAILRGVRPDEVEDHAEALLAAGIRAVETPLNSPEPLVSVARLAKAFGGRMAVGAGTVLTGAEARQVAEAGGDFAVAPNVDAGVIAAAIGAGLEPVPGFATPTEAIAACQAGATRLKLFPAASLGPAFVAQVRAVLAPKVRIWAVGGVRASDYALWRTAGVEALGLGGDLYQAGQTVQDTAACAQAAVAAINAAR